MANISLMCSLFTLRVRRPTWTLVGRGVGLRAFRLLGERDLFGERDFLSGERARFGERRGERDFLGERTFLGDRDFLPEGDFELTKNL